MSDDYQPKRGLVVVAVGLPGAGKTTFFEQHLAPLGFERCGHDGQPELTPASLAAAERILQRRSPGLVYVDRYNCNAEEREIWPQLARVYFVEAVVLRFGASAEVCVERCKARQNHEFSQLHAQNPAQCESVIHELEQRYFDEVTDTWWHEGFAEIIEAEDESALEDLDLVMPLEHYDYEDYEDDGDDGDFEMLGTRTEEERVAAARARAEQQGDVISLE